MTKRTASSPADGAKDDTKRLRLPDDLWSEVEHQQGDEKVKERLGITKKDAKPRVYATDNHMMMGLILSSVGEVAAQGSKSHLLNIPSYDTCVEALEKDSNLMELVGESYKRGSYKDVRCLPMFRVVTASTSPYHIMPTYGQEKAVEQSWKREYSGDAAQALWNHISGHYNSEESKFYAHFAAIVQSSGMGKSRTVDELGKHHFVIPINLRGTNSTGFPPADHEVRDFLTADGSQTDSYSRSCAFLEALFENTTRILKEKFSTVDVSEIASQFRINMTEGQTFQKHNAFRTEFYHSVIQSANKKFVAIQSKQDDLRSPPIHASPTPNEKAKVYDFSPAQACKQLVGALLRRDAGSPSPHAQETCHTRDLSHIKNPLVILAFDEAHTLTDPKTDGSKQWSKFSELRYTLRALHRFPCFSLFMSTTGKISQFTSAQEEDVSLRILTGELSLIQPFTDLGFDTLAHKIALDEGKDMADLAGPDYFVHFGRPLFASLYDVGDRAVREDIITFAATKLLNADPRKVEELTNDQQLACLSQRLPLEFNSTTYIAQVNEKKQVEGHMRVCLKIDDVFESMVTVSASEPLLSEAAYGIMSRPSFNAPKALKSVLEGFSINKGDRGELLVMLLLTIARDKAVGPPAEDGSPAGSRIIKLEHFLAKVFRSHSGLQHLYKDFNNSKIHFNHYVRVHEFAAIDSESLLLLSSRGAGVLCAPCQNAIDGIHPFLLNGSKLTLNNFGLILWQSKNDSRYTDKVQPALFNAMDVYGLKILNESDPAVPLIKIVFALAAKTPFLHIAKCPPSAKYGAIVYEIWSAGISPDILSAVEPLQANTWTALLQASYGWQSIYQGPVVDKELRRSMNPGAASSVGHWRQWATRRNLQ